MIYLHKILPLFVLPVGITILLVMVGLRLRRRSLIWTGVALLWLSSTPFVSGLAVRTAEGWAERGLAADASEADAIVVLSEGRVVAPGKAAVSGWNGADRFFGGIELFKAGKSPLLVSTPTKPKSDSVTSRRCRCTKTSPRHRRGSLSSRRCAAE